MDLDQDRQNTVGWQGDTSTLSKLMLGGCLVLLAGIVAYLTFKMELTASGEFTADAAMLIFIGSAVLLSIGHARSK
jgi:hypothetical protein